MEIEMDVERCIKKFGAKRCAANKRLVLGGEGEKDGIQVNLRHILDEGFRTARDGRHGLSEVKKAGPVVISASDQLPFETGSFDQVYASSVPIDQDGHLGPGYTTEEIARVLRDRALKKKRS